VTIPISQAIYIFLLNEGDCKFGLIARTSGYVTSDEIENF